MGLAIEGEQPIIFLWLTLLEVLKESVGFNVTNL